MSSFKAARPRLKVECFADLLDAGNGHPLRAQARDAGIEQARQYVGRMADGAEQERLPYDSPER